MSDRIDEYHGDEAKVLTTDEARADNIELRCQLVDATSVATKLERERDAYRRELDAELKAGLVIRARNGARNNETFGEFVDRLERERNAAERERDACTAELADRYDAKLAVANAEAERDAAHSERDTALACYHQMMGSYLPRVHERDAARATIAELVTALEGLFVEYDHLRSAGSRHALTYWVDRLPDHACAECMPDGGPMVEPGFRCREHAARAALAKAKGGKS